MSAKRWKIGFGIVAMFAIAVVVWLLVPAKEGAQPYDGDLKPERRVATQQPDGYALLQRAVDVRKIPQDAKWSAKLTTEHWDAKGAAEVLAENREALKRWEALIAAGEFQIPEPKGFSSDFEQLNEWRTLVNLAAGEATILSRQGRTEEALNRALQVVQFGQMIEEGGGPIFQYIFGAGMKATGLERMRQLALESAVTPKQLQPVIDKLAAFRASESGLSNSYKVEYQLAMNEFEKLRSGKAVATNSPFEAFAGRYTLKATFNLAKTRQRMADGARVILKNVPKPMSEMDLGDIAKLRPNPSIMKLVLGGNGTGEVLAGMTIQGWTNSLAKKCQENSRVAGTQAVLAIRSFQLEERRLPGTLTELVPKYLPTVPVDGFDGKPLRYLRDKKIVYSVGQNLIDDGGAVDPKGSSGGDVVFELEPKKAAGP